MKKVSIEEAIKAIAAGKNVYALTEVNAHTTYFMSELDKITFVVDEKPAEKIPEKKEVKEEVKTKPAKKVKIDTEQVVSLRFAGRSFEWIADELGAEVEDVVNAFKEGVNK